MAPQLQMMSMCHIRLKMDNRSEIASRRKQQNQWARRRKTKNQAADWKSTIFALSLIISLASLIQICQGLTTLNNNNNNNNISYNYYDEIHEGNLNPVPQLDNHKSSDNDFGVHRMSRRHTAKADRLDDQATDLKPSATVLLDTTELSALDWTKYPDGISSTRMPGWAEESFTNFERGINWRSFVVCDVAFNSVNNWLWSPFIERSNANRLYIEIKFTMRDCNLFPQMVLSCKETFALLYKEMDSPIWAGSESGAGSGSGSALISSTMQTSSSSSASNLSFAQADSFSLIDAIAADEGRFTSNNDVVINTEVRSVPVSKRGVHFAFRDQGACLSLISIKVYHISCPALQANFAHFNATPTGRDLTSLVAVEGNCVANALQIEQPKMFCTADGRWNSMSSGLCKCLAGFEPAHNNTKCQACAPGKFKHVLGDSSCQPCPERSYAPYAGATECKCVDNYFRAPKDSRSAACTQPPSGPNNLSVTYVDSSSVILQWQAPKYTGNRDDLTYKLICQSCDQQPITNQQQMSQQQQLQQQVSTSLIVSSPQYLANFSETKCVISGLAPATNYRFIVYAMNGVSQMSPMGAQFSEISVQTLRPSAQTSANSLSALNGIQLLPIYNFRAMPGARGSDMVLSWDVAASNPSAGGQQQSASPTLINSDTQQLNSNSNNNNNNNNNNDPLSSIEPYLGSPSQLYPSLYEIRFVPRRLLSAASVEGALGRRSPYPVGAAPASLSQPFGPPSDSLAAGPSLTNFGQPNPMQAQTITTTNRAVALSTLLANTEYAFQIRAKLLHSQQWSELSEPVYASTGSGAQPASSGFVPGTPLSSAPNPEYANMDVALQLAALGHPSGGAAYPFPAPSFTAPGAAGQPASSLSSASSASSAASWLSWLASSLLGLLLVLALLALGSMGLVRYRKSRHQSCLGAGFGGSSAAYAGVYGGVGGFESALIGAGLHAPAGHHHHQPQHHHHHAHTLSSGSAGGLITGSNTTSRSSSSGAGNVVHNIIAATLGQLSGGHSNRKQSAYQHSASSGQSGKLFASSTVLPGGLLGANSMSPFGGGGGNQRNNHYHQTTTTLNLHQNNATSQQQQQQQQHHNPFQANHTVLLASQAHGLFQPRQSAQQQMQHIYMDQQAGELYGNMLLEPNRPNLGPNSTSASIGGNNQQALKYQQRSSMAQANGAHSLMMSQQDPQNHIYDDLETTTGSSSLARDDSASLMAAQQSQQSTSSLSANSSDVSSHLSHHSSAGSQQQQQQPQASNFRHAQRNSNSNSSNNNNSNIESVIARNKPYFVEQSLEHPANGAQTSGALYQHHPYSFQSKSQMI